MKPREVAWEVYRNILSAKQSARAAMVAIEALRERIPEMERECVDSFDRRQLSVFSERIYMLGEWMRNAESNLMAPLRMSDDLHEQSTRTYFDDLDIEVK